MSGNCFFRCSTGHLASRGYPVMCVFMFYRTHREQRASRGRADGEQMASGGPIAGRLAA